MDEPIYNTDPDQYSVTEARRLLGVSGSATTQAIEDAKNKLFILQRQKASHKPETMHKIFLLLETLAARLKDQAQNKGPDLTWSQKQAPITQQSSNVIIRNPNSIAGLSAGMTEGRLATSNDAPPGHINPINVRTTMQLVNVDSRFRDNYFRTSASRFRLVLPEPQKGVVAMRLVDLEIPLTSYAVSADQDNNTFIVKVQDSTSSAQNAYKVTLPDGNYELAFSEQSMAMPLVIAMNDAIALAEPGTVSPGGIWSSSNTGDSLSKSLRFAVDQASGRATFARPTPEENENCTSGDTLVSIDFSVDRNGNLDVGTNIQAKLGWLLGFRAGKYENPFVLFPPTTPGPAWSITGEAPVMIQGPRYGFLAIDDHQKNVSPGMAVAFNDSVLSKNVMSRFAIASIITDRGVFQLANEASHATSDAYRTREYFGPVNVRHLDFTLCDDLGRVLNLNNCDWSCLLAFEKVYD